MELKEKLLLIQTELKAPKNQRNAFGNYNYRSAEDILEAVKPLCLAHKVVLTISDDIVILGQHNPIVVEEQAYSSKLKKEVTVKKVYGSQRFYVKAIVTLRDVETDQMIYTSAFAREEEEKAGMDTSQITGSASSYARKYALNGLFDIDDTKDADATNTHGKEEKEPKEEPKEEPKPLVTQETLRQLAEVLEIEEIVKVKEYYKVQDLSNITQENALKLIAKKKRGK